MILVNTKWGSQIDLAAFHGVEVALDITHSRTRTIVHASVVAHRTFRDAFGHQSKDTLVIREFSNVIEAEDYAAHLRERAASIWNLQIP